MISILNSQTAKTTILKRVPPGDEAVPDSVLDRIEQTFGERITPDEAVTRILRDIRTGGDSALHSWTGKLDGKSPQNFRVSKRSLDAALHSISEEERAALELAAARIEAFYKKQPLTSWITQEMGGVLGQLIRPIQRVGLYIPGGTAPLPSSVLMSAVPAKVAGVKEIVMAVPPQRGTGEIAPIILAAAALVGVEEVYAMGGAQAIGALAYGTESIHPVDKIFGPGNLFVTLAKKQVFGVVGIDGLAGPTETVVIADDSANPAWVASDLLAQAEHDVLASAILLTPSKQLAESVQVEVGRQMETLPRADIVAQSLAARSGIVITADLDEALSLSNAYGPEHLCLSVKDPWLWSEKVTAAGGIFMGEYSFEVLGDYIAGPSHVMPTGGTARFASPLNVWDFVHIISLVGLNDAVGRELSKPAAVIARSEGLEAHARSADRRGN
ncbi:MAG TPA: histidinol dehydrogenase [Anaerolineales bacterium]|nr:histidinol dehydrogenase [Anaerolineales bacterium]